ncbi:MAG: STAS domain-containing protein [Nocardioidaceae bacterium]|nr:STAS domain-containing protein [Nocardioidaceae bacterium]NUS50619.1 STAS domain-containing protein [Nocardioidaceae bacterium]
MVAAVVEVAVEGEATRVTVDLADVDFVDSSGLATFIKAHRLLEVRGARLTVAGAQPHVRRMFPITGIDQVVRLVDAPPGQVG